MVAVSLPTSTCKAQCIEFVAACGSMLAAVGATKPDCANALNQAGLEEFPYDASIIVLAPGLEVRFRARRRCSAMFCDAPRRGAMSVLRVARDGGFARCCCLFGVSVFRALSLSLSRVLLEMFDMSISSNVDSSRADEPCLVWNDVRQVRVSCTVYRVDDAMLQQVPRASCQAVDASSFPLSQCQAVVNYPVYVPDGSTISDLDQTGSLSLSLFRTQSTNQSD